MISRVRVHISCAHLLSLLEAFAAYSFVPEHAWGTFFGAIVTRGLR